MASPDATPYTDLTMSDLDPQMIFEYAIEEMKIQLPDWTPREGNTEVVLLEGMSVEVAELVYAINRVPSAVLQALLRLYGIEYDSGAQPVANLTFGISSTIPVTIPQGTEARLDLADEQSVTFSTDNEVTIPGGQTSVTIPATGDEFTAEANGTPVGTVLEAVDSMLYLDRVTIAEPGVTGGRDEESDEDYFDRGVNILYRLTSTLVTPAQFVSAMLESPAVERAYAVDNYNVVNDPDGNGPAGTEPGHISLFAYGDNTFLSVDDMTELANTLTPLAMAALSIHFANPTVTTINVDVTVVRLAGWDGPSVQDNVRRAVEEFLSPMTWDWSKTLVQYDLITAISNATGVKYVQTMTTPSADVSLTGQAPLTKAGTITVTVTG